MNRKQLLAIGFLALVLGAFVSHSVYRMLQSWTAAPARPGVEVAVAARDLQVGIRLGDADLKVAKFQADDLPPNCFQDKSVVVGRGVLLPMAMGDFVLPSKLAAENGDAFSALSSPGMRALSVRVSEMVGGVDLVQPGARVDVMVSRAPRRGGQARSTVVLENVEVIAVGPERNSDGVAQVMRIALLLLPDDARKLTLARLHGLIQLSLRFHG